MQAFLCTAAPRYLPMVAHLRREQRRVHADIVRLRANLERRSEPRGWMQAELGRVARAMVTIDELETDLLCAALESTRAEGEDDEVG
jgi:hypothetical protein